MNESVNEIVESVFDLYRQHGDEDYIGEPVSQIEHMSQAAQFAMQEGFPDEVILAAFFHDIGHICSLAGNRESSMGGYGTRSHEKIGADYLRNQGFPETIARLVENHVQAKRYLTYKYPLYYNQLSEASRKTLEFQGGVMTDAEAIEFEKDPQFEVSILMRKWDEMAKIQHRPVTNLDSLKLMAQRVLTRNVSLKKSVAE
jgi:2-amino-1-hydroxyethylphosphonate dioxygenase (glycine-forming)